MTAYIVHVESNHPAGNYGYGKRYTSVGRAKAAMKRMKLRNGEQKYPEPEYKAMSVEEWQAADVMVETRNLLNPEAGPIMIPKSQKGTACDPGTERYHCM